MNISQIKSQIEIAVQLSGKPSFKLPVLQLNTQTDKDDPKKTTDFVSHWDDAHRVRISMPREIMNKIKANPAFDGLAFKSPVVVPQHGDVAEYLRITIITPQSIEATF